MENFLDHTITICFSFVIIGSILGAWTFIGEKIVKKFNLQEKLVNFIAGNEE